MTSKLGAAALFTRYAIYFTPEGRLADLGAAWLGWDQRTGQRIAHPAFPDVDVAAATDTPRKYGLHGTIKPPFVLAPGKTENALRQELAQLCAGLPPVSLAGGLEIAKMGKFLALKPKGETTKLAELAAGVVRQLDTYRAPPTDAELARRRKSRLSVAQEMNLANWGYPYVLEEFRFHMTLSGALGDAQRPQVFEAVARYLEVDLPMPFEVDGLSLVGQGEDGMFRLIERIPLTG